MRFGNLQSSIHRTKGLETWTFVPPERVGLSKREVQVSIRRGQENAFEFVAQAPEFPESFVDTDLSRLFATVESWFTQFFIQTANLQWEDWLEVVIKGNEDSGQVMGYTQVRRDMSIAYRIVKRAITPEGAPVMWAHNTVDLILPFPAPKRMGVPADRVHGFKLQEDYAEYAYMPATPENVRAVQDLQAGLSAVRQKIADMANGAQQGLPWTLSTLPLLEAKRDE